MRRATESTTHEEASLLQVTGSNDRMCIVFFHAGGIEVLEPKAGSSIVVGRAEPADLQLKDRSLSRQHASLRYEDGKVWVKDLGSRNGTYLRGARLVEEAQLRSGEELRLGGVVAQLRITSGSSASLPGIDGQDEFLMRVEEEVIRARAFRRPLSLLMLRGADEEIGHFKHWCAGVRSALRPVDRMALYGRRTALLMLPELDCKQARQVGMNLITQAPSGVQLACGIAQFPQAARTHEGLVAAVHAAVRRASPREVFVVDPTDPAPPSADEQVVVGSPRMLELHDLVARVAPTSAPVLVLGETGTGKEVIARALHRAGPRAKGPLRTVNCGALPPTLTESLLFGHERGAYTGATSRNKGVFEHAHGGTVFLDEVGELAPGAQTSLLRILETKTLTRVGSSEEITVDVRIVAATNCDLEAMIAEKRFRADLFYRLNTLVLRVPPLRERPEEIQPMAALFLRNAAEDWNMPVTEIAPDALACLQHYDWPGNVRELRNVIERAVIMSASSRVEMADLPEHVRGRRSSATQLLAPPRPRLATPEVSTLPPPEADLDGEGTEPLSYRDRVREYERNLIKEALRRTDGNRTRCARMLNIPLRTLTGKIRDLGVEA